MEKFEYVNLFSTKGTTYILVIVFLISFTFFIKYLNGKPVSSLAAEAVKDTKLRIIGWFKLAQDYFYHQGHSWVTNTSNNRYRIGIDDFAQKMLGTPSSLVPIKLGKSLQQGKSFMQLSISDKKFNVLSPLSGRVVAINNNVLRNPATINNDPYNEGWILELESDNFQSEKSNLLFGNLAKAWIEDITKSLNKRLTGNAELVMQDGGEITPGFVKELDPENWDKIAKEYMLN